jgi:hypothetical protein
MNPIETFEKEYPALADAYKGIMKEQYALFAKKMLAYGIDNISLGTSLEKEEDKKISITGVWIRCMDKMNRLKNLVLFGKTNFVEDESVLDTYKDLVNYNVIAQIVLKDQWKKKI